MLNRGVIYCFIKLTVALRLNKLNAWLPTVCLEQGTGVQIKQPFIVQNCSRVYLEHTFGLITVCRFTITKPYQTGLRVYRVYDPIHIVMKDLIQWCYHRDEFPRAYSLG